MYKDSFVHNLTKILIDIMFFGGILCLILIPFATPKIMEFLHYGNNLTIQYSIILMASGAAALYILWQLKAMFKTLVKGHPFIQKNVSCLRKCSVASVIISIIYLAKSFWILTMSSAIIAIIFALLGLFCLTLKDLFKQSIAYKEENDWTV